MSDTTARRVPPHPFRDLGTGRCEVPMDGPHTLINCDRTAGDPIHAVDEPTRARAMSPARAQEIADDLTGYIGGSLSGGKVVYNRDGSGGQWYSGDTFGFGGDVVVFDVGSRPYTAQDVLDTFAGEGA